MHGTMLERTKVFADKVGYQKLSDTCKKTLDRLPKEPIPLPKTIPKYIDSWLNNLNPEDLKAQLTLEEMFERPQ